MKSILIFIIMVAPLFVLAQTTEEMLNDPKLFNWNEIEKRWKEENSALIPAENTSTRSAGEPIEETEWNQFGRLRYIMEPRVGKDGKYVNIASRNLDAETQLQKNSSLRNDVSGKWSFLGPTDVTCFGCLGIGLGVGRVNTVFSDGSYEYAGSAGGGAWRRPPGGTWSCITNGIPNLAVSGITTDPSNSDIIYILTGDGDGRSSSGFGNPSIGVLKSTDGGDSWLRTGLRFPSDSSVFGFKLKMDPNNSSTLYACTTDGLYKTTDGAASWTLIYTASNTNPVFDIEFKPGSTSIYYFSRKNTVVRWNGNTFTTTLTTSGNSRIELAVTPANTTFVYALCGANPGGFTGLFKSINSGLTFGTGPQSTTPNILGSDQDGGDNRSQANYDLAIAASTTNANIIYVGGINIWKSTNGGQAWIVLTNWTAPSLVTYVHADQHCLEIFGSDIWNGNDGGVYHSTLTDDDSWVTEWAGLGITQFYKIAVQNDEDPRVIGGAQDNGTLEYTGDEMFTIIGHGDGGEVEMDNDNDYYFSENEYTITPSSTTFRPFDDLETCDDDLCNSGPCSNWAWPGYRTIHIQYFSGFPDDPFPYYGYFGLYEDEDEGGGDCVYIDDYDCEDSKEILAYFTGNIAILGSVEWLLRSDKAIFNYGGTYVTYNSSDGLPTSNKCSGLWMDENDNSRAWVTFGGYEAGEKVYLIDYGGSITNISGTLPNVPVNCIVQDPSGNNALYIGTDIGVFYRDNNIGDWVPFRNGMPSVMVSDLKINPADSKIYAATYGRGMYRSPLSNSCATTITVGGSAPDGFKRYQAEDYIKSTQVIDGGVGNEIVCNGGNYVQLNVGFEAKRGSEFRGLIEGCSPYTEPLRLTGNIVGDMPPGDGSESSADVTNWFELSPNPCLQSSQITLHLYEKGNVSAYITNMQGQIIFNCIPESKYEAGNYPFSLNASTLSAGIFLVHVVINGKELVEKLVKQ